LFKVAIITTINQEEQEQEEQEQEKEEEETGSIFRPVNNLTRQQTTFYLHAQHWQKDNTQIDNIMCALNYALTYAQKYGENQTMKTGMTIYQNQ
jgi:hypothetical protein